jgi:hypothetical protein
MIKLILRKQWEIVDKDPITKQDMMRAKVLLDIMNTVSTINGYYNAAPALRRSPMQAALAVDNFGVRPGSRIHKMIPEEEEQLLNDWEVDNAAEEAELKPLKADMEATEAADGSLLC